MKTLKVNSSIVLTAILTVLSVTVLSAQETVLERTINEPFDRIAATGVNRVFLSQGTEQKIRVEAEEDLTDKPLAAVKGSTLEFDLSGLKKPTKAKFYVTYVNLHKIDASGAAVIKGETPLNTDRLDLEISGAAKLDMEINTKELSSEFTGAADVTLSGIADYHRAEVSGAVNLRSSGLQTSKATIEASGASNVKMNVTDEITGETSGVSKISLTKEPARKNISKTGMSKVYYGDVKDTSTVEIDIEIPEIEIGGEKKMIIDENGVVVKSDSGESTPLIINDDGVKIIIREKDKDGKTQAKVLVINDDGVKVVNKDMHGKHGKSEKKKFDGHWQGFEIGVNGFLNKDNKFDLPARLDDPKGYDFLDLRMEKSINVRINFLEQNFNLYRQKLGLVTGLGLEYVNYRFDNNVILEPDSMPLYGSHAASDPDITYKKSKLVVNYLNLPLFLEYQTNPRMKTNSFHLAAGMTLGWRIGSHTKVVYTNGKENKDKERDDFYLNPFKYDATVRVGWGVINLYGTYSLNTLFRENKGPEVYPFAVGITLTDL